MVRRVMRGRAPARTPPGSLSPGSAWQRLRRPPSESLVRASSHEVSSQKFECAPRDLRALGGLRGGTSVAASVVMRSLAPSLICSIPSLYRLLDERARLAGGTGGRTGSGTGGTSGTGGAGGSAGSPGTVTLQVLFGSAQTFCDENAACSSTQHLSLMTAAGQPLTLSPTGCVTSCATCGPVACPEYATIACPAGNWGTAVTGSTFAWDGTYFESGACEPNGASVAIACLDTKVAPAGTYIAQFCATPGTLSTTDGGGQLCTATGAEECAAVEFSFPSPQPVVIAFPASLVLPP